MSTGSPQKKSGKPNVERTTLIRDVLELHPDVPAIYRELSLPCDGCSAAEVETLEQGAKLLGMNDAALRKLIERLNALPPAPEEKPAEGNEKSKGK